MLVLLSDEAAARRFAEAAEVLGEVRMTTDPACANTASAVYIDLSRFDEVSQTVPSGLPVVIAERGEDPARVLAKLKKRMDLRSKGRS